MGEKHVNLHPEAIKFREELQGVFSSFKEITLCGLVEKFTDYLKTKNKPIEFITVHKYLTKTTPPAWMFPHICEFLSQEPYSKSPIVWTFLQVWGRPVDRSLVLVREQVKKSQQAMIENAEKFNQFL